MPDTMLAFRDIRLVDVAPFTLGELQVIPATRQVIRGDECEVLEPRVMQVLVALAEARGAVISRDQLIERCWGGVVVGENAIQRTISRIRHLEATLAAGSFELETITKVGYRMIVSPKQAAGPPISAAPSPTLASGPGAANRRLFLAGSLATTAMAAVSLLPPLRQRAPRHADETAEMLYQKGIAMREGATPDQAQQALAYFREATRLAPNMAKAWGGLAFAYADSAAMSDGADYRASAARARMAADRALRVDATDPDARTALLLLQPMYRNWLAIERFDRETLRRHPENRRANGVLGQVLGEVGRWREAAAQFQKICGPDDFIPLPRFGLVQALWAVGRIDAAEAALEAAVARWPKHPELWELRVRFLTFTGRPGAALDLIADRAARPFANFPGIDGLTATAEAVQSGGHQDRRRAADVWLRLFRANTYDPRFAMEQLAALGALDDAFAIADGVYLGSGRFAARAAPRDRFVGWFTSPLLAAVAAPMRADQRFAVLIEKIGLDAYWRQSGTLPDDRSFLPAVARLAGRNASLGPRSY